MDLIDEVTYRWEWDDEKGLLSEHTRQAFCNLFDIQSEDARLVMREIVNMCGGLDNSFHSDTNILIQHANGRWLLDNIKKQLCIEPIEEINQDEINQGENDE